jgi:myosin-5
LSSEQVLEAPSNQIQLVSCSIPFSVEDIAKSMPEVDLAEVHPPPLLKDNAAFHFLQPQADN